MADVQATAMPVRDGPEGIGGWLILPMIGIILTPVQGLMQTGKYYSGLAENYHLLTSAQRAFLGLEIVGQIAIAFVFPVVLLILLFNKRRAFPRIYVIWATANLVFILGDLLATKILFGDLFEASGTPLIDGETFQALARAMVLLAIWVPYMRLSRRVRNTFTR